MKTSVLVTALCGATIALDGYDLIVYGATVPALLRDASFGPLTPAQAGAIGSYALAGMLVGALAVGTLTDLIGRRRVMLGCLAWFSLAVALSAAAPTPELLGVFRFMAGLGLGGVMPTASALTFDYAPTGRKDLMYAIMFSGYSFGGIAAAGLSIVLLPVFGWRGMFALGAIGVVILFPVVARFLPDSSSLIAARARASDGHSSRRALSAVAVLFSPDYIAATMLFWVATFAGLLLVYFPIQTRATALGWSLGVGRLGAIAGPLVGGLVLSSPLGVEWNYYVFAGAGLVGLIAILLVPRVPAATASNWSAAAARV